MIKNQICIAGDIGGTNARFAICDETNSFHSEKSFKCSDFDSLTSALNQYLTFVNTPSIDHLCLAVAGPIRDNGSYAVLTNNPWIMSTETLKTDFSLNNAVLINDFTAIAYSLPHIDNLHLVSLNTQANYANRQKDNRNFSLGVMGPGTGLGVSALYRNNGVSFALSSEAGHLGFSPENEFQSAILSALRHRFEQVTREHLLSGPGIENLYWALGQIEAKETLPLSAETIFEEHQNKSNPLATRTVDLFFELLGQAAGDLALSLGTFDGVYIAGGICHRHASLLKESNFVKSFENRGKHRGYMENVPTYVITHPNPGLLGACKYLESALNS
jgi:glucokinase